MSLQTQTSPAQYDHSYRCPVILQETASGGNKLHVPSNQLAQEPCKLCKSRGHTYHVSYNKPCSNRAIAREACGKPPDGDQCSTCLGKGKGPWTAWSQGVRAPFATRGHCSYRYVNHQQPGESKTSPTAFLYSTPLFQVTVSSMSQATCL